MNVYDAIEEMRRLSKEGVPFCFTFMSCDLHSGKSEGVVEVRRARLRARESVAYNRNAEMMEGYVDLDTGKPRHFYQPLLMTFNGIKTVLE